MGVKKIEVKSRFAALAARKGGPSRDEAIAAGKETVESFRPEYREWVAQDLDAIDALLRRAAEAPSFDARIVSAAYARVANVRDLGTTFDHPMTTAVADRLCELLYRMRHAGSFQEAAVRPLRDALRHVSATSFQGKDVGDYTDFLRELDQVVALYPEVTVPTDGADGSTVH